MTLGLRRTLTVTALFALAAGYFSQGVLLTFEWIDEGQVAYASWRVAAGELPYRDLQHGYWPSVFFLNGTLFRLFGTDLRVLRLSLVVLKAVIAVLVFCLARRVARWPAALGAFGLCVVVFGAPYWVFNTPYGSHYTIACALLGVLVILDGQGHPGRFLLAGLCFGVGATFKQSTGAFAAAAALVALVLVPQPGPARAGAESPFARVFRRALLIGAAAVPIAYVLRPAPTWSGAVLAMPWLAGLLGTVVWGRRRGESPARAGQLAAVVTGMALPPLLWVAVFLYLGALPALVQDTITRLPGLIRWFVPLTAPPPATALALGAVGSLVAALAATRLRRAGLVRAGLVMLSVALAATRLARYPVRWEADTAYAVLWVPFVALALSTLALWRRGWLPADDAGRALALLHWLAAGVLMALHPAVDVPHAAMLFPVMLPLLAHAADRVQARAAGSARRGGVATVVLLLLLVAFGAPFVATLARARASVPLGGAGLARATGVWQPSRRLVDTAGVVALLDTITPVDRGLVVLPSEQITYVLANRPSTLQREEAALYLVAHGLISHADANTLADQPTMIGKLAAARPVIVRWRDAPSLGRFRSAFPTLAAWIDTHYRSRATIGQYEVLEWADAP